MPTNRTRRSRSRSGGTIPPQAIDAWRRYDFTALHLALDLAPWEPSPLPAEIDGLGVSEDDPPDPASANAWDMAYPKDIGLQRQLVAAAGWPDCRTAYEKNLQEAQSWARYCCELVDHPERGGQGTGCDPQSRRQALEEAKADVAYRKKLLADLGEPS
jgi:hypothetical protein